jgi:hypothetical protein
MKLACGYSRKKNPPIAEYREMTPEEAGRMEYGQVAFFCSPSDNRVRRARVNGKI